MGPLLRAPDVWLEGLDATPIRDQASVSLVRDEVRRAGGEAGLPGEALERLVSAASELAQNQLAHARNGRVAVRRVTRLGVAGVEVIAADEGQGIADPVTALRGGSSTAGSLGVGLSAAQRLSDEMDLDVRWDEGTCVRVRTFAAPVPRSEVGVLARASRGESICGDDAVVLRGDGDLVVAVADGLGHGPLAREPSALVVATVRLHSAMSPGGLLRASEEKLRATRGAVAAIARLDFASGALSMASVGNVSIAIHQPGSMHRIAGTARTLGSPQRGSRRVSEEQVQLGAYRSILLFSDGVSSRANLSGEMDLLQAHPIAVAQRLVERFGRSDDDVLVVAVR